MPSPNVTVNPNYTEGFVGYPHNLNTVIPFRLLDSRHGSVYQLGGDGKATAPGSHSGPVHCGRAGNFDG